MPQLNPLPWFVILASTWTIFLFVLPHKFNHLPPANTSSHQQIQHTQRTWPWPWQ